MEVRVGTWGNGKVFGFFICHASDRDEFFDRGWNQIEVQLDGVAHRFHLTPSFWRKCREFRDRGQPVIREWLRRQCKLDWPKRKPPRLELRWLRGNCFALLA